MSNKIINEDKDSIEVITTDDYFNEGLERMIIVIENKTTRDSSHINLTEKEASQLRDLLNEWLVDYDYQEE